ncbi:MAG: DNA repair exonuclease [Phycisphaerae bacterium]|nr:DNA repair exonuclease [Phycisphaerae bacterium]
MFKFIHAADLHLDSPFRGVSAQSELVAETLRAATFEAFDALISLCLEKQADFLLIAGDVYDGADRSLRAQLRFRDGLATLAEHGIRSFVVHGNHDPLDGWSAAIDWPDGIHIFRGDQIETVTVERDGRAVAAISGISYPTREEKRNLAGLFRPSESGLFEIGLLHCNCGGNTGHEDYAPCRPEELVQMGLDYWALGHVHTKSILGTNPHVVYPGNTQGRNIRETGERGCYCVTVDDLGAVELEFCALDAVRWLTRAVSIVGVETVDALEGELLRALDELRAQGAGRPIVARLELTGRGPLHRELRRDTAVADLLERLRETGAAETPFAWVQDLELHTRPEIDLDRLRESKDLLGQTLRIARNLGDAPDLKDALAPTLAELYDHARVRKAIEPLSDAELKRLLEEAELLCVDLLEGEA